MRALLLGILVILLLAVALQQRPTLQERGRAMVPETVRLDSRIPRPATVRLASLGHHEAVADLLWLHALGYFGEHVQTAVRQDEVDWLSPHIDAIVAVDPRFRLIYVWAGTVPFYDHGGRERVELANRYLRQGLEVFPNDWRLHFMLGINLFMDMQPVNAQERREFHAEAGYRFRRAAESPNAPATVALLSTTFDRRSGAEEELSGPIVSRLLRAPPGLDARGLRGEIDRQFAPELAGRAAALRQIRLRAGFEPGLRAPTHRSGLFLHPDPTLAVPAEFRAPLPLTDSF
ncbi:MAG: hypothetical protein EA398_14725 [Deltaproteobacteria bacterium]|nr:MAG: hypothetical protein EA398_14725 [Deltaproteobacteria bacterium]